MDRSIINGGLNASCAGVIRDAIGTWLGGFSKNLGSSNVLMAELRGIYTALEIAWEKNFTQVWIESDSPAVRLANEECPNLHAYYVIIMAI